MKLADLPAPGISRLDAFEAVFVIDGNRHIVAADAEASRLLGLTDKGAGPLKSLVAAQEAQAALDRVLQGASDARFEISLGIDGPPDSPVQVLLRRMDGESGPLVLVTLCHGAAAAVTDALTGLPDRRAIADQVASWRAGDSVAAPRFAVLFLDLDGFKQINDEHGHAAGDHVLQEVSTRLASCVRDGDLVSRYGGDEFVLLLKGMATVADAEPVVERVKRCAGEAIHFNGVPLQVSATVGVAIAERADQPIDDVVAAADRDMYARKRRRPK